MTQVKRSAFVDTNVLLYSLEPGEKAERAEAAILDGEFISVQVLNEFANTVRRKGLLSWQELATVEASLRSVFTVLPLTLETHDLALRLAERYGFHFYDALIVASALGAGCRRLYTEDLQHGQRLEGRLDVINPFC